MEVLKMNKIKLTALLLSIALIAAALPVSAADVSAVPSNQTFYLDGTKVELAAYNINGNNYVKLRDLYKTINYDVSYKTRTTGEFMLRTYTDRAYTPDGSETNVMPTANATAYTSTIYALFNQMTLTDPKDAKIVAAYKINGSNYIQLRNYAETLYAVATADYSKNTPGYTLNLLKPEPTLKTFDVRYNPSDKSVQIISNVPFTGKDIGDNSPVATPKPTATPAPEPSPVIYASAPKIGDQPARITNENDKYTKYYSYNFVDNSDKIGGSDCNWYATGRFYEVHNQTLSTPFAPPFNPTNESNWNKITDLTDVPALSIAVYNDSKGNFAHVLFVEYVERDKNGKPINIYFTESGASFKAKGKEPGLVQKLSFANFKQRVDQTLVAYIVPK
jgi:hypothetical protein